jgi:hypothetical protein
MVGGIVLRTLNVSLLNFSFANKDSQFEKANQTLRTYCLLFGTYAVRKFPLCLRAAFLLSVFLFWLCESVDLVVAIKRSLFVTRL